MRHIVHGATAPSSECSVKPSASKQVNSKCLVVGGSCDLLVKDGTASTSAQTVACLASPEVRSPSTVLLRGADKEHMETK